MTELSYLGLPSILVPYPTSADDHQTKNAEAFSNKDAALLYKESELDAETLKSITSDLIKDAEARERLSVNIRQLSLDPAGAICDLIESTTF